MSHAFELHSSGGFGTIKGSGAVYLHKSFTLTGVNSSYEHALWLQGRYSSATRKRFRSNSTEAGFGEAVHNPNTALWLGGGAWGSWTDDTLSTHVAFLQSSYGFTPRHWIQLATTGSTGKTSYFEGPTGQGELIYSYFGNNGSVKVGGIYSIRYADDAGSAALIELNKKLGWFGMKALLVQGDFPHWFDREALLRYESSDRQLTLARISTSVATGKSLTFSGTLEYNKSKESQSWFGSLDIVYRSPLPF